jgi:methyl-accepting chemotaxis protein
MTTEFGTGIAKGENSFEVGKLAAQQAISKIKRKANLSIVFSSSKYNYNEVVKGVRAITDAPLIGCSTAGEFTEEKVEKESIAVGLISTDSCRFFLGMAEGLKEDPLGCVQEIDNQINIPEADMRNFPNRSVLTLGDGLTGRGDDLATSISMTFNTKTMGGMAGDDLKMKETHVFMNDKIKSNAVSVCEVLSKSPMVFGVKHGHIPISPLFKITRASEDVVYELDNKPAWEVWKEYCSDYAKKDLGLDIDRIETQSELIELLIRYQIGIPAGSKYVVRHAGFTTKKGGPFDFPTPISEGTNIRIMKGTKESQIKSAKEAAEEAISQMGKENIAGALVFDCAVRSMILKDDLSKAIDGINDVLGVPLIGFETYGEIGMKVGDPSGFHNTTTVVALIPK